MAAALPFPRRFDWRGILLVGAAAFVGAISFQGSRGLFESTEGRYSECARETMLSGNYDAPILNGQPHWTKPPLTYMAIMAGMRVFGDSPWGVRAYLVAAMGLSALAIWLAGTSIWGPKAGLWAGLVFATSPVLAGAAHVVSADMLTAFWVAAATAAFWHGRAHRSPISCLAMWVFLGLGVLTKGPPALLVPAASLTLAAVMLRRNGGERPPSWLSWTGLVLFLAVGLLWYVEEAERTPGLLAYWIGDELIGRNLGGEFHRNPGFHHVFTMYLPILLLGAGPWLPLVVACGRPLRGWWAAPNDLSAEARAARVSLAAGIAIPFVVFSLSKSKLPLYLAPLFVPLSLGLGRAIDVLIARGRLKTKMAWILMAAMLALIVVGKGIMAMQDRSKDMTRLAAVLIPALEREDATTLYTATGRNLNGLEFHLGRIIPFVPPQNVFAHAGQRMQNGETPLYVISSRNWKQIANKSPGDMRTVPLGRHWLLLAPRAPEAVGANDRSQTPAREPSDEHAPTPHEENP